MFEAYRYIRNRYIRNCSESGSVQVFGCHAVVGVMRGVGRRPKSAKGGNRGGVSLAGATSAVYGDLRTGCLLLRVGVAVGSLGSGWHDRCRGDLNLTLDRCWRVSQVAQWVFDALAANGGVAAGSRQHVRLSIGRYSCGFGLGRRRGTRPGARFEPLGDHHGAAASGTGIGQAWLLDAFIGRELGWLALL